MVWTPTVEAAGNSSDESDLQAQNIIAMFDSVTEQTSVHWANVQTSNFPLMQQMQDTRYLVYRHSGPLNESVIIQNGLEPWDNVSACPAGENIANCPGMTFQSTYPLPAGTNGTFYYAIVTYFTNNNTMVGNFVHGEANVSEGVSEITNPVTAPFFVQAIYDSSLAVTDISWINLNTIVPFSLPEVGPSAYSINIYRHNQQAERSNWMTMNHFLITTLVAGETSFRYTVPAETDDDLFYSVTYDYMGYEDVRFLGTNTLTNPVHEDNIAPISVTDVEASFSAEPAGGTGNTTISWTDIDGENGETYHIWRSGMPINDTTNIGVELVGEIPGGYGFYQHEVERGMLGLAYYAVTASDANGNHNSTVSASASISLENAVEEDTFTPWIAEPTDVIATYLGNSQSLITWTDQLGVEGETYHVWRSSERLTSLSNLNLVAELIATIPDSVESVTVDVPPDVDRTSYYCVSSLARYSHSAQPYEDLRFQQNCANADPFVFGSAAPITEDTLRPAMAVLTSATMNDQAGQKISLLTWVNNMDENDETYQLWAHHGDPFGGNESIMNGDIALDDGWVPVQDPVSAPYNNVPSFSLAINLDDELDQNTWYAVTTTDQWGNLNTDFTRGQNAKMVHEDTTPATVSMEVVDGSGQALDSLRAGQYKMRVYVSEALSEYPIINITTSDYYVDSLGVIIGGHAFTEQTSAVRADPIPGVENGYQYPFEILNTMDTSEIRAIVSIRDVANNVGTVDLTGWSIDAKLPEIEVYAPAPTSLYLYGESIHVYGAVTDDVEINSVQIKFRWKDSGLTRETEWTDVTDLTPHESDASTLVFEWWEPAATFVDLGSNQRVFLRATDTSGNEVEWESQFTVDHCIRTVLDFSTACDGQSNLEPAEAEAEDEPGLFDGVYLMIYILGAVNLVLLIVAMMSLVLMNSDGKKKKGDDDEEDDDWMMEFMGGSSGGDDGDSGSAADVRSDMDNLAEGATERTDVDDPFAASEGRDRKRREKKTKKEEVVEDVSDDDDDDDEFDDEDDWDDEDTSEKPKRKSVKKKRKSVKRRK
jgi:hypothetical protein